MGVLAHGLSSSYGPTFLCAEQHLSSKEVIQLYCTLEELKYNGKKNLEACETFFVVI